MNNTNIENIAYCGLYCADCPNRKGIIADLARDLRKELRCGKSCRNGGGNPSCKIKRCVQKKQILGCWECDEFETCDKLKFLEVNHGKAHIKNLKIIKKKDVDEFIIGKKHWYATK